MGRDIIKRTKIIIQKRDRELKKSLDEILTLKSTRIRELRKIKMREKIMDLTRELYDLLDVITDHSITCNNILDIID